MQTGGRGRRYWALGVELADENTDKWGGYLGCVSVRTVRICPGVLLGWPLQA